MALHLVKLCVGVGDPIELGRLQRGRVRLFHLTRMMPKRAGEILGGGSLYWVFSGYIRARQEIEAFEPCRGKDGVRRCRIVYKRRLILTEPRPRRPFQGWRYLEGSDIPSDIGVSGSRRDIQAKLDELGLF